MNLLSMIFPPVPCYFLPLRPKYVPEHTILEHPQPMFLPESDRPSFTHTHTHTHTYTHTHPHTHTPTHTHIHIHTHTTEQENYSSCNPHIFGKKQEKKA